MRITTLAEAVQAFHLEQLARDDSPHTTRAQKADLEKLLAHAATSRWESWEVKPRVLRRFASPPAVVFVSAYDSHAVEAFDLNAVDYVMKPVREERLRDAVTLALSRIHAMLDDCHQGRSPGLAIIMAGIPLSQVATPSTPRRVGRERIRRPKMLAASLR